MKLAPTTAQEVEILGVSAPQQEFQIKASALAFKILSSGLYSDQIRAVIRELSTNAYDAHLEAGKGEEPFKVHLPTRFEPWFSVTDFGVGMSHERVMKNYTTYFGSSKQDTNDLVGCLGLGSKSPFAYTETFTLISIKDGVKRTYTALISEEGYPKIMLLSEEPTEEHNGVHVQFPVKLHDLNEFHHKARLVYMDFPVKPTVNAIQNGSVPTIEYTIKTPTWGLRKGHYNEMAWNTRVRVVQGCVAYPLDTTQLDFDHPLLSSNVDLFVPIGSVEVTPGRESLSYTQHTNGNLKGILEEVLEGLVETYAEQFDQCKTRIEAILKMNQLRRDGGALFGVVEKRLYKRDFKHFKLSGDRIEVDQVLFPNVELCRPEIGDKTATLEELFSATRTHRLEVAGGTPWSSYASQEVGVTIWGKVLMVYDDLGKPGVRALLSRMDDNSEFHYSVDGVSHRYQPMVVTPYLESYEHGTRKDGSIIFRRRIHDGAEDEMLALAEIFEATVVRASDMLTKYPPPPRAKTLRAKTKVRKATFSWSTRGWNRSMVTRWSAEDIDTELETLEGETKFYVPIQDRVATLDRWFTTNQTFQEFRDKLIEMEVIDSATTIYGVPVKELPNVVEGRPEWVPLVSLLEAHIRTGLPKTDLDMIAALQARVSVGNLTKIQCLVKEDSRLKGTWLADAVAGCTDRLMALEAVSNSWTQDAQRVTRLRSYMELFGVPIPTMQTDDLLVIQKTIMTEHPTILECNRNHLVQYVRMVQEVTDLKEKVASLEAQLGVS